VADITDEKQKPEEVPGQRQHLEAFSLAQFNAMGDGILSVDQEGVVVLSDRVIRQTLEIYPGASLREHFPQLWPSIAESFADGNPRCELPLQDNGSSFLVTIRPIVADGVVQGAICVFAANTDLEGMARQMRSFRELSRELATIIDSSSEGLWICDGEGTVLRINPASERINRVKAEEVVGRNARELLALGFFDRSAALEVIQSGETVNMLQNRGGRKLIVIGTPVYDDEEKIIRVVVSERDVTEIDKLQRELEEQEAIRGQIQHHMLEQQQMELVSHSIIAKSPKMINALRAAIKVATANSTVLLLGESGVGKGLFADLIHKNSKRSEKPLIKINCGAIPESLIESELFGHEKGAFTGAQAQSRVIWSWPTRDSVLDEIAELPLSSQVKLLRFLEDGRVTRLGGTAGKTVDVRILAATHRDLEKMVEEKTFRLDLYYRLNVIPLSIPSLRERRDCIVPMIHHFIEHFGAKNGITKRLTRAALDALLAYSYPGNVRELINICERLVVMTETALIDLRDLPGHICKRADEAAGMVGGWPEEMRLEQILESVERALLHDSFREYGNQYRMAEVLGVNQSTIARKLKKYGIV
jgi:PAS domain S-box-containing protein/TyrR family helix-turn-helix protein